MMTKLYSDQKNWSDTYLTDPKLVQLLGPFDTDPCCPENMPWKTATMMFTENDNGLSQQWLGRVFMNPPYRGVLKWAKKFVNCRSGIALLNGRSTETQATQLIMKSGKGVWFLKGRLTFYKITGEARPEKWLPSLLIGLSDDDVVVMENASKVYDGIVYHR